MIKLIKTADHVFSDILKQQKILYHIIDYTDIAKLTKNDILCWDMQGIVSYHNIHHIMNFLDLGGKIIIVPDENYKIFTRIESKNNDVWNSFIQLTNKINKKEQILVLIEGKIYQKNDQIRCTIIEFGYFEFHNGFISNHYNYEYKKNMQRPLTNYGTAAVIKPTRIFREKFYEKIKQTDIDISQMSMPTNFIKNYNTTIEIPNSLYNSYCSIIHETDVDPYVSIVSEKTLKPIILEKFWIVLADYNYYDTMKFLGFDVFEDIFDLSFSREINIDRRVDLFVDELVRLNYFDFEKLNNQLKERITENKYNLSRALSIDYHQKVKTTIQLIEKHH